MHDNNNTNTEENLTEILHELNAKIADDSAGSKITLGEMLKLMHTKGIILCILILALPSFFPGLLPPFPSILAIPMILLAWQLVIRKNSIALPKFIANIGLKRKIMGTILTKFIYYLDKLPQRRNGNKFIAHGKTETIIGIMIIIFASIMFIPLPLTNFLPSVGTAIVALGVLKQAKSYVIVGSIIGFVGVIVGLSAVTGVIFLAT